MKDDLINENYLKLIDICESLNIEIIEDNKLIDKDKIINKVNNFKKYLKNKTLKMLDIYYNEVTIDNFFIKLEKIYKVVKKYENKIDYILDNLNNIKSEDDKSDNEVSSIFLDSDIDLKNFEIKIEDIKEKKKFLDEYKNS
jgi:tRNA G26 N,N-dimethylase Trm1